MRGRQQVAIALWGKSPPASSPLRGLLAPPLRGHPATPRPESQEAYGLANEQPTALTKTPPLIPVTSRPLSLTRKRDCPRGEGGCPSREVAALTGWGQPSRVGAVALAWWRQLSRGSGCPRGEGTALAGKWLAPRWEGLPSRSRGCPRRERATITGWGPPSWEGAALAWKEHPHGEVAALA
jgi:hypothetical protein